MKEYFNKIQSKSIPIAGTLVSAYILFLSLSNQLTFYIHPDYRWLATTMSFLLLIVSITGIFYYHPHQVNLLSKIVLIPAIFVLIVGIVIKPTSLTSNTALRRGVDEDASILTKNTSIQSFSNFGQDTRNYDISIWLKSIFINPDPAEYAGKKLTVVGFYHKPSDMPQDYFYVSRYVVTCCSVDARAVGLYSEIPSNNPFKEGDWISVDGEFETKNINGKDTPVIKITNIKGISKPDNSYIY